INKVVRPDELGKYTIDLDTGMYKVTLIYKKDKMRSVNVHVKQGANHFHFAPDLKFITEKKDQEMRKKSKEWHFGDGVKREEMSGSAEAVYDFKHDMDGVTDVLDISTTTMDKAVSKRMPAPELVPTDIEPKAGTLTAGHWRDLTQFNDWLKTNENTTILSYQKKWGMYPQKPFHIQAKNKKGKVIQGAKVTCMTRFGMENWSTITDANGEAVVWPELFKTYPAEVYYISITPPDGSKPTSFVSSKFKIDKLNQVEIDYQVHQIQNNLEIAFLVDATGSMGDEIQYLKAEMANVITTVKKENPCLNIRTGSVF